MIRATRDLLERIILALVVAVALADWAVPGPARLLDRHQAIDAVLALLVFASAMTVPAGVLSRVRALAARLGIAVIAAAAALPALAFALSRLLGPAALRDGVLAVGVAPAEVASVAITGIAGGEVGAAAVLLVASTLICVAVAGPILSVVGGHGVSAVHVLITLSLVVGLPLLAGLLVKRLMTAADRLDDGFQALAIVAVVVLVWLVSAQVRLSAAYGTQVIVKTLLFGNPVAGYPSLMAVVLFLGGIGILAVMVSRITHVPLTGLEQVIAECLATPDLAGARHLEALGRAAVRLHFRHENRLSVSGV